MSMYWNEDKTEEEFVIPDDVVDLAFDIQCQTLPVDHAYALYQAIHAVLPWFGEEPDTALHLIHVADSGNGWERPSGADDLLYLSRRTKLTLRLPKHRVENAQSLMGQTLDVAGHAMTVGKSKVLLLSNNPTLYARYVAAPEGQDEAQFIAEAAREMQAMGVRFKKILAGKQFHLRIPGGKVFVRSLMVADLSPADAVTLQVHGVGAHRELGCGVFIPHKSIKKVNVE